MSRSMRAHQRTTDLLSVSGQEQRETGKDEIRHNQNTGRNDEVQLLPGVLIRHFYILPENFLVAILDDKNIVG